MDAYHHTPEPEPVPHFCAGCGQGFRLEPIIHTGLAYHYECLQAILTADNK